MSKKLTKAELVDKFLSETPKEFEYFVQHSMDISIKIIELLKKHKLTQRQFATKLGKSESEISKWLSGNHNLTLKSISKLEAIFNEQIIFTENEVLEELNKKLDNQLTSLMLSFEEITSSFSASEIVTVKGGSNNYNTTKIPLKENSDSCPIYSLTKNAA